MNAVEKLARLNAPNVRFDIGSGGLPDLTPQDIAAGIAFVPAGLGRELLLVVGWPDGARPADAMRMAVEMGCAELNRQFDAMTTAGIRHVLAQWEANGRRRQVQTPEHHGRMLWPRNTMARLPHIVAACMEEIAHPNRCGSCKGRGSARLGDLLVVCPVCDGRGNVPVSDRKRAAAMGVSETTYRTHGWGRVYGWMLSRMLGEFHDASGLLADALRT